MKRTALLTATLAITLLVATSLVMAQTPSVPNLINFQGRLTDNVGNPVANAAHTVDFYIFPVRTGGGSVWNETQTPTTTGGLFTTQLGLVNPLPATLFEDYDSLFLEIVADAQLISPRTLLTSTPSARVADNLEVNSTQVPGTVAFVTDPSVHSLVMNGNDGLENFRVWGAGWGQLLLHDATFANNLNVILDAGPTDGTLTLNGVSSMLLNAGASGDASAILPTDAVNADEMLNEPGIAHEFNLAAVTMSTTITATDTISLTVPTSGFVVVIGNGFFNANHTAGTSEIFRVSINTTAGSHDFSNITFMDVPSSWPSASFIRQVFYIEKVTSVGPGTHTYYLNSDAFTGSGSINRRRLTAMFFPTNYGTVVNTIAAQPRVAGNVAVSGDAVGTDQPSEVQVITVEDHQAQVEAERAKQMAELEARIKRLEGQAAGQLPGQGAGTPRKER